MTDSFAKPTMNVMRSPSLLVTACAALLAWSASTPAAHAQPGRLPIPIRGQPRDPTPAEREFSAGDALLQRGDLAGARTRFEAARRLDPRDPRPVFYLGEVARRQEQWADAERLFRDAITLRPTMAEAHAQLGAVLREQDRARDAVAALEAALRIQPSLGEAHHTLALCLEDQGDTTRATQEYRTATRILSSDPFPPLNLGLMLAGQPLAPGAPTRAEALQSLREAVRRGGTNVSVLASAGPAFRRLGEARTAAETLERARAQGSPTASLLGELAQALWASGDRTVAEQRIGEAIALSPREASLRYLRGLMLAEAHQNARAVEEFRSVVQLDPEGPLAGRARARIQELSGNPRSGAQSPSVGATPTRRR